MLVSPELALVDPDLAAAARALLPAYRVTAPAHDMHVPRRRLWPLHRREVAIAVVGLLAGTALGDGIARLEHPAAREQTRLPVAAARAETVAAGAPVTVRWAATRDASYFDFVLWRDGRRVLDAWPTTPTTVVPASWTYRGKRYELARGHYTWFVYPGLGSRSETRYGALTASGRFIVGGPRVNG